MESHILSDIIIICGFALSVTYLCNRFGIPAIVGFLFTGIISGPHGLGLISQIHVVEQFAEVGVVCLLFTIGLEFSIDNLLQIKTLALVGGAVQVLGTMFACMWLGSSFGLEYNQAIFFGLLVSLSSTAIVLQILQRTGDISSPHGRMSLGILIFQDIAVIPMTLLIPLLAGGSESATSTIIMLTIKMVGVFVIVVAAAKWFVPNALYQVAKLKDREMFFLGVVFIGLGIAWITSEAGLSLALGAFLAGLIISESDYGHRALGSVIPFRDLFTSFFFVSIGMLLDLKFFAGHPFSIIVAAIGLLTLKLVTSGFPAIILGFPLKTAILSGLALCGIGEFAFVLLAAGYKLKLVDSEFYQTFLGISILTMIAAPFLIASGSRVSDYIYRLPLPLRLKSGLKSLETNSEDEDLVNHLIIVGYGLNGRHLFQASKVAHIPVRIIEMNPDTVRKEKANGVPIFYGDASQEAVLEHAKIHDARAMTIVISDPAATRRVVETAKRLNPSLYVVSRTRYVTEMDPLYELGADVVIPEDYEASVEVLNHVLTRYLVPREDIEKFVAQVRSDHYGLLRSLVPGEQTVCNLELYVPDTDITTLRVHVGSILANRTLGQLKLRKDHGVTVLAIRRGSRIMSNPGADDLILPEDSIIVMGDTDGVISLAEMAKSGNDSNDQRKLAQA